MDYTCKICGATVSKRQSLAFEEGRVCRKHVEEINKAKKEKEERVHKIKKQIVMDAFVEVMNGEQPICNPPNRWQIVQINNAIAKYKKLYDANNETNLQYGTEEYNTIDKELRIDCAKVSLTDGEILRHVYSKVTHNRASLKVTFEGNDVYRIIQLLSWIWYDLDVSEDKHAFTVEEFLEAIVNDVKPEYFNSDSPKYKEVLEGLRKRGPDSYMGHVFLTGLLFMTKCREHMKA